MYAVQVKDPSQRMNVPSPKRRVYKQMKFGEGLQPGAVEWKMLHNQSGADVFKQEKV